MRKQKCMLWLMSLLLLSQPIAISATTREELEVMQTKITELEQQLSQALEKDKQDESSNQYLGTFDQPTPLGQPIEMAYKDNQQVETKFRFTLTEIKRGKEAHEYFEENDLEYEDPSRVQQEWVLLRLQCDYLTDNHTQPHTTDARFSLINPTNRKEVRVNPIARVLLPYEDDFSNHELLPNESHAGYIAFVAPKNEPLLFVYQGFADDYYFDMEPQMSEATKKLATELHSLKQEYKQKALALRGAKDYPVPVGQRIGIEEAVKSSTNKEITVKYLYGIKEVLRGKGATDIIEKWRPELAGLSNDTTDWVLAMIDMQYLEDYTATPFFSIASMEVQTESGQIIPQNEHHVLRDFGFTDLRAGAFGQALIAFQVPKNESFQFIYNVELEKFYFDGEIKE